MAIMVDQIICQEIEITSPPELLRSESLSHGHFDGGLPDDDLITGADEFGGIFKLNTASRNAFV